MDLDQQKLKNSLQFLLNLPKNYTSQKPKSPSKFANPSQARTPFRPFLSPPSNLFVSNTQQGIIKLPRALQASEQSKKLLKLYLSPFSIHQNQLPLSQSQPRHLSCATFFRIIIHRYFFWGSTFLETTWTKNPTKRCSIIESSASKAQ